MQRQDNRVPGLDLALDDDAAHSVRPTLQPFTRRNQPLRIVLLFSRASLYFAVCAA